jgi:hypothetical protein
MLKISRRFQSIFHTKPQGGLSYVSGSSSLPLLGEHTSQQLRRKTLEVPNKFAVISHHQDLK